MPRILFLLLVCIALLSGSSCEKEQQVDGDESAMLKQAPWIDCDTYQCAKMVQIVNHLRQLGKDKSVTALPRVSCKQQRR